MPAVPRRTRQVRGRAIVVGGFTPSPVSARVSALTINKIKTVQNTSVAEVLLKVATPWPSSCCGPPCLAQERGSYVSKISPIIGPAFLRPITQGGLIGRGWAIAVAEKLPLSLPDLSSPPLGRPCARRQERRWLRQDSRRVRPKARCNTPKRAQAGRARARHGQN